MDRRGVIAIDAGQTGVRAAGVVRAERAAGVRPLEEPGAAEQAVRLLAGAALEALPEPGEAICGVGLSGFHPHGPGAAGFVRDLHKAIGCRRVLVANDAVIAHLGALRGRPGVVCAAGTGAVVLGLADDGRAVRVDGAGHLLGDDGSGFAIGRAGLRAALRACDGRGAPTALRAAAERRWGDLERLPSALHAQPSPVRAIASFATDVAAAARAGDETAAAIWRSAAEELAASVAACVGRLFSGAASVAVSRTGSLFAAGDLLPFEAALAERCPAARLADPAGDGLDGAAMLAGGGTALALGDQVVTAGY